MRMSSDNLKADRKLPLWTALKLAVLWIALLILPFTERTLLSAKTYHFLQHAKREPVYAWIAFLFWSVFICSILAVFAFEYDLLPHTLEPSITQRRPLIDYLYFEIMTFTTVGYGDIVPHTVQGKFLAICTALLGATHGVTFVAIILQALNHPTAIGQK